MFLVVPAYPSSPPPAFVRPTLLGRLGRCEFYRRAGAAPGSLRHGRVRVAPQGRALCSTAVAATPPAPPPPFCPPARLAHRRRGGQARPVHSQGPSVPGRRSARSQTPRLRPPAAGEAAKDEP